MGWEKLVARKNELEEEVRQLEKVKRNWMTEVDIITKQMDNEMEELMKLQVLVREAFQKKTTKHMENSIC